MMTLRLSDTMKGRRLTRRPSFSVTRPPRIVILGGGSGPASIMPGILGLTLAQNISVIVPVSDNGGSSGRLARQSTLLPPGDARQALAALAGQNTMLARLLNFQFGKDAPEELRGHKAGNVLLAAMNEMVNGDFARAPALLAQTLGIAGRVCPSTAQQVTLVGEMEDGRQIEGETQIAQYPCGIRRVRLLPEEAVAAPQAVEMIRRANIVLLGPGSIYSSIIPNLMVQGIADAVHASSAVKIYICNVAPQPGETDGYVASDYVNAVARHVAGRHVMDYAIIHNEASNKEPLADADAIRQFCVPVFANVCSRDDPMRHDPKRIADIIMRLWSSRNASQKDVKQKATTNIRRSYAE